MKPNLDNLFQFAAFAYVGVVALLLVGVQPFPVLHDYAEWMYQGWLLQTILAGAPDQVYQLASWPVPNSLSQFAMAGLNYFVSPLLAGKIWLGAYLLLGALCCWRAATQCWPDRAGAVNLVLVSTLLLGPGFWNGYINFQLSLVILLVALLGALRGGGARWLLIVSVPLFFAHAAGYIVLLAAVAVVVVAGRDLDRSQRLARIYAMLPTLLLLGWYLKVKIAASQASLEDPLGAVQWLLYKAYTVAKQGPFHNFIVADGSSLLQNQHWLYLGGMLINAAMLALVLIWGVVLLWQAARRQLPLSAPFGEQHKLAIGLFLAALLVLFLGPGRNNFGVVNLGERFLIPLLGWCLLVLACPRSVLRVWAGLCLIASLYTSVALVEITRMPVSPYSGPQRDIYSASRHQYFNHRLFIYADRGLYLNSDRTAQPRPVPDPQLATGPLILRE